MSEIQNTNQELPVPAKIATRLDKRGRGFGNTICPTPRFSDPKLSTESDSKKPDQSKGNASMNPFRIK